MSRSARSLDSSPTRVVRPPPAHSPPHSEPQAKQQAARELCGAKNDLARQLASSNVYILTADGSSLFLLNPSAPSTFEQPPPYIPCQQVEGHGGPRSEAEPSTQRQTRSEGGDFEAQEDEMASLTPTAGVRPDRVGRGRVSSTRMRASSDASHSLSAAAASVYSGTPSTVQAHPGRNLNGHSGQLSPGSQSDQNDSVPFPNAGARGHSTRGPPGLHRIMSDTGPPPSTRHSYDGSGPAAADERTPLLSTPDSSIHNPHRQRAQSLRSSTGARTSRSISISTQDGAELLIPFPRTADDLADRADGSPALPQPARRSNWRNMLRAPSHAEIPTVRRVNTPGGDALVVTRPKKKAHWFVRYTRSLISAAHWGALFHLVFLNLPFAILLWPILVAGTLAGTALLITLPIGALVWFLVLILSRTACRLELSMQIFFHSPLRSAIPRPVYFNIFRRIKVAEAPGGAIRPVVEVQGQGVDTAVVAVVWEKNFLKNAWSMFSDHISYQCLSYLILTKALITLLSSIVILVVVPISFALIIPFPGALELVRRFGRWQAGVAVEALQ